MSLASKTGTTPKAYIAGVGMVTPLGVDTSMTTAVINAGITPVSEVEFYDDDFAPLKMCLVPDGALDSTIDGVKLIMPLSARQYRMLQLSVFALSELEEYLPEGYSPPVFLAGPEDVVLAESTNGRLLIENLAVQSKLNIDIKNSRYCALGRAGGLDVIDTAIRYFEQNLGQLVIVGGVDTFYDRAIMTHYVSKKRLIVSDARDGFIPGEGAGFLLLVSPNAPERLIKASKSYVVNFGSGFEEGYIGSDRPYRGDGLATAWGGALNSPICLDIQCIMSSMNGEHYFAKELGVAITRNNGKIAENPDMQHPAEFCGDLGAAMGPVMVGVLQKSDMLQKGTGLVYCSSDGDQRCAVTIKANAG